MSIDTKKIVENAFIAAIYFVVTLICMPLSYGLIQFRVSELLMLLCFFRKDFVIGLTIGCFLSNLAGRSDLYYVAFGYVFLGELVVVSIVGYIFFIILIKKDKKFLTRINASCNLKVKW